MSTSFKFRMKQLELRHFECFDAVVREGSFGKAATVLDVGQPFVSLAIQRLEKAVGETLIVRRPIMALTPTGTVVLTHVRAILASARSAESDVSAMRDGEAGEIRIGFPNWLAPTAIPEWIASFSQHYPDIQFTYRTTSTTEQLSAIINGDIDVAFVREPMLDPDDFEVLPLLIEPFLLAMPITHGKRSQPRLSLSDFQDDSFLLFDRGYAPGFHDTILNLLLTANLGGRVRAAAPDWYAILGMVRAGSGLALVPSSLAEMRPSGLDFRPLTDVKATSTIYAVRRKTARTGAQKKLIEWLEAEVSGDDTPMSDGGEEPDVVQSRRR